MTLKPSLGQLQTYTYTPTGAVGASTIVTYQSGKNPSKFYSTITSRLGVAVLTNRPHKSEQACVSGGRAAQQ
jgi:hypothetical protein